MNRKQFATLLVLGLVLGGLGLMLYKKNASSYGGGQRAGKKVLGDFQINDVAQINIKQGAAELNLVKKDDLWRVRERSDYPANFSQIADVVRKLAELKVVQAETVGPSQLPKLELAAGAGSNSPTVVELRDGAGKALKTLLLGKKHMSKGPAAPSPFGESEGSASGRWVMVGGATDSVALVADALENVEPKPDEWLEKEFFKIEKPRSVSVTFPVATNSWKITRETEAGEWKLTDAKPEEKLDAAKSSGATAPLSSPSFVDVVVGATPEQTGLDKPTVITIETFDDLKYTVNVGAKKDENYHLTLALAGSSAKERTPGKDEKPEDKERLAKEFKDRQAKVAEKLKQEQEFTKWTYLVSGWSVEPLLKDRVSLLEEKKADEAKAGEKHEHDEKEPK